MTLSFGIKRIERMAIVGTGVMGSGIAQIAAQAGIQVKLFDARDGAAQTARDNLGRTLAKLAEKGKITAAEADASQAPATTAAHNRLMASPPCGESR